MPTRDDEHSPTPRPKKRMQATARSCRVISASRSPSPDPKRSHEDDKAHLYMMLFEDILLPQILLWPAYFFLFWKLVGWGPWVSGAIALPAGILSAAIWWGLQGWRSWRKNTK
jgi:hypothetical protein